MAQRMDETYEEHFNRPQVYPEIFFYRSADEAGISQIP
jgi:hypothetical protein